MKKVLIITYYFPPAGGAGVQRTLKFVKYLREFGWEPIVLTARNADYPIYDRSLVNQLPPGINIFRAPIFEPYHIYRRLTGKGQNESIDISTLSLNSEEKRRFSEKISEWIRATFFIPDARIAWLLPAFYQGKRIIAAEKIDLLFSSAPPYTTHLIARKLKHFSGLPWVADFRDSWIGWLSAPQWRPALSRAIENWLEEKVLKEADRLITVTHGVREDLLSRHPHLRDHRWYYLPNGYDENDFVGIKPAPRESSYIFTYTGSLYGNRNPQTLLAALERMLWQDPQLVHKVKIRIVGRVGASIMDTISRSPASKLFQFIPYLSHQESLAYLLATDALLLIIDDAPNNRGIVTGKIYEYIGAKRPILALAPEGEAADLIRHHKLGIVVAPNNIEDCLAAIDQLLSRKIKLPNGNKLSYSLFERREQTRQLVAIFDAIYA